MQTQFSLAQLADTNLAEAERIVRKCVHCGFCQATCPTYLLLGDELDSPRGRIYMIKDMLEGGRPASDRIVRHVDRCLSCLGCMSTCPSDVNYMHLVDHARVHIEQTYRRPWFDRMLRGLLAAVLPRPRVFRLAVAAAWAARSAGLALPGRLGVLLRMAPANLPRGDALAPQVFRAIGPRRMRVALLTGCVQTTLAPQINEASVRLLRRLGCEVVVAEGAGCCGALTHHLGKAASARAHAAANIAAWAREMEAGGLDAIVANASGCGTMLKEYGFLLADDPDLAGPAAALSARARDISEVVAELGLPAGAAAPPPLHVAYHAACSLAHGQGITDEPKALLEALGFTVSDVPEGHICCGSAGSYNLLQPEIASRLAARKAAHIGETGAQVVAAGNIGCMVQIGSASPLPVVHTIELLDWATGGPAPEALAAGVTSAL
jgi:glycolate oxidase iron-sulfur subunit